MFTSGCIVAVPDYVRTQVCGAVVRFRPDAANTTLNTIRSDTGSKLAPYMLPICFGFSAMEKSFLAQCQER